MDQGLGVTKSETDAKYWIKKAADNNFKDAIQYLSFMESRISRKNEWAVSDEENPFVSLSTNLEAPLLHIYISLNCIPCLNTIQDFFESLTLKIEEGKISVRIVDISYIHKGEKITERAIIESGV